MWLKGYSGFWSLGCDRTASGMESSAVPSTDIPVVSFCKLLSSFINTLIVQKLQTAHGSTRSFSGNTQQHFPMDDNASEFRGAQGFLKIQQLIVRRSSRE